MRSTFRLLCSAVALGASALATSVHAADGAAVFRQHCAMCHGADGKAQTPMAKRLGVRDLSQSKLTEAQLGEAIVAGVKNSKGVAIMPAFGERLKPDELAALVTFVKGLQPKS